MGNSQSAQAANPPQEDLGALIESKCTSETFLAQGTYKVYKVNDYEGKEVAVKAVLEGSDYMKREWELHKDLKHENVVKLLAVAPYGDYTYLVLELCAGSLDQLFLEDDNAKKYNYAVPSDLQMLYQIASGIAYIHESGLVHRDIKPQNILFSRPQSADADVHMKVADFGCAKPTRPTGSYSISGSFGTPGWNSPEIDQWNKDAAKAKKEGREAPKRVSNKTDVFSTGLVFFYFLTKGKHPFGQGLMLKSNMENGNPTNFDKLGPHVAKDLIRRMITKDPNQRPTMNLVKSELEALISAGHQ